MREDFAGEVESAGIENVFDAERAEVIAFAIAASGGEDFGASALGDLNGGEADSASGRMDEDAITATNFGDVFKGVAGGEEGSWNSGGSGEAEIARFGCDEAGIGGDVAVVSAGSEGDDFVAEFEGRVGPVRCVFAEGDNAAGAFAAQDGGGTRVHSEGSEDVAEIQARGVDLNFDLAGSRGVAVRGLDEEIVEDAGVGDGEAEGRVWIWCDGVAGETGSEAPRGTESELGFDRGGCGVRS